MKEKASGANHGAQADFWATALLLMTPPTLGAIPDHVKPMIYNQEIMLSGETFFYRPQFFFNELDHFATLDAAEMTVMALTQNRLIMHVAIFVPYFLDKTAFHNKRYIPIDRGL
jgi:hypothetical protein